jgi:predicted nucleic acid-binding protein
MYLLDTNVISEIRRPSRHGAVILWLGDQPPERIFVPSIAFLELQRGVELTKLQDPLKASDIERWIDEMSGSANVLDFDVAAAREYSRLARSKPDFVSEDAMIAAIARTQGLTVATRNIRDFKAFDVLLFNPFEYAPKPRI